MVAWEALPPLTCAEIVIDELAPAGKVIVSGCGAPRFPVRRESSSTLSPDEAVAELTRVGLPLPPLGSTLTSCLTVYGGTLVETGFTDFGCLSDVGPTVASTVTTVFGAELNFKVYVPWLRLA